MKRQEALVNRAVQLFNDGFNCAQSSFKALCEHWGIPGNPKVATCFGGGIGRTGAACGILTGSLMALGLLVGNDDPRDIPTKERATRLATEFVAEFRALQGQVDCNALTGFDISTPEGHQQWVDNKAKQNTCIPLMRKAMVLMDEFARKEGIVSL